MAEKAIMVHDVAETRYCNAGAAHAGLVPAEYELVVRLNEYQSSNLVFCLACLRDLADEANVALLDAENAADMRGAAGEQR